MKELKTSELEDSGAKWAAAFCERWPSGFCAIPGKEGVSDGDDWSDTMIGWFANAIEVSSDHRKNALVKSIKAVCDVQRANGNWNYDHYMHGMANGMLLIAAMVEGREYEPLDPPDEWLADRPEVAATTATQEG